MSACYVEKIIDLAKSEIGYKEKATNEHLDDKIANAGHANYNKYAKYIDDNFPTFYNGKKNGYDWCDVFVDYLFIKAYGFANALRLTCQPIKSYGASCTYSMACYKNNNRFGKNPELGSQIFFGSGNESTHTGIVIDYNANYVYTVEGNAGDGVCQKIYPINDSKIVGYGHPEYAGEMMKSIHEIAKEVIKGDWGVYPERKQRLTDAGYNYDEVMEEVNRICTSEDSKTYTIDIDSKKYNRVVINLV